MTLYWDLTDSSDYDRDEEFVGRYYGDVLDDEAFADAGRTSSGDDDEAE